MIYTLIAAFFLGYNSGVIIHGNGGTERYILAALWAIVLVLNIRKNREAKTL